MIVRNRNSYGAKVEGTYSSKYPLLVQSKLSDIQLINNPFVDGLKESLDKLTPDSQYQWNDDTRGIIYVGGGKYWPGILTGIRMLQKLGCPLPIEVWYRPEEETVEFVDGVTYHEIPGKGGKQGGWAGKLYALYHTRLKEVLYLDADAYCVENPLPLFQLLQSAPFVYWEDFASHFNSIKWSQLIRDGMYGAIPPIQGGQLLINREKAWKLVHTCKYMCDNREFYFRYMYGDQDTWRVGLTAKCCEALVIRKALWLQVAFICSYEGSSYIIHRCQSKLFESKDIPSENEKYSRPVLALPKEKEVFDIFHSIVNKNMDSKIAFKNVYKNKLWGPYTHIGGNGSRQKESIEYIQYINKLIKDNDYKSVIDLGCSEGTVGLQLRCDEYTGYDCVESQIDIAERKRKHFPHCSFICLDFYSSPHIIYRGDLLLCRDVLHHWPNVMVKQFLDTLIELKKWRDIVISVDRRQLYDNQDTYLGGYRGLDSTLSPLKDYSLERLLEYQHKVIYRLRGKNG